MMTYACRVLLVTFVTDGNGAKSGFRLKYTANSLPTSGAYARCFARCLSIFFITSHRRCQMVARPRWSNHSSAGGRLRSFNCQHTTYGSDDIFRLPTPETVILMDRSSRGWRRTPKTGSRHVYTRLDGMSSTVLPRLASACPILLRLCTSQCPPHQDCSCRYELSDGKHCLVTTSPDRSEQTDTSRRGGNGSKSVNRAPSSYVQEPEMECGPTDAVAIVVKK